MKFNVSTAEVFVPDGLPVEEALSRTTYLAVGAHQDDLEIMAVDGILKCFQRPDRWFTGVVVTDGRGSPRSGHYAAYSDAEMAAVRRMEQKKAAIIGEYAAQVLLDHPSSAVKDGANTAPVDDLLRILEAARPEVVYTHNLADKHDTHVGVALKAIEAVRRLPVELQPQQLYGCEVWRDLDWMNDDDKVAFNISARESLQAALLGVFDSQIAGGKRYDLASMGRRRANATYFASHETDEATGLVYAMDLMPLVKDPTMTAAGYLEEMIGHFMRDIRDRLQRLQA
jgi:LmbE family N-acetylglucosaminyl deacetylase